MRGGAEKWGVLCCRGVRVVPQSGAYPGSRLCAPPFLQCLCSHSFKISKIIVVGDLAVGKTCLINR